MKPSHPGTTGEPVKTSRQGNQQLFALIMSALMSIIMTGVITAINTGLGQGYVGRWVHAFALGFPLAFACILLLGAPVRRLVTIIRPDP